MVDTPDVLNDLRSGTLQKILEVHLVEHPFDVGQTDLERGVTVPPTVRFVYCLCVFL